MPGNSLLLAGLGFLPLRIGQRLAGKAGVAAGPDDGSEDVVRDLHAAGTVAVFVGEEPGADELVENRLRHSRTGERVIQGATVTKAARRQQPIFNEDSHAGIERLKRTEVEVFEYFLLLQVQKFRGNFRVRTLLEPTLIELLQHQ